MSVMDKGTGNLALVGNFFGYCETLKSMPNEARLGLQNTDCECYENIAIQISQIASFRQCMHVMVNQPVRPHSL